MKPKGQDVADAIVDWSKDEIKKGPADLYDLGKFFFSASAGTLGAVAAIAKLDTGFVFSAPFTAGTLLLLLSSLVAVNMVRPRVWAIEETVDLYAEHDRRILVGLIYVRVWTGLWLVGTVVAGLGVFPTAITTLKSWLTGAMVWVS